MKNPDPSKVIQECLDSDITTKGTVGFQEFFGERTVNLLAYEGLVVVPRETIRLVLHGVEGEVTREMHARAFRELHEIVYPEAYEDL